MDKRRDLYSLERSNYGNTRNENSFTGTSETARDQQYVQGTGVTWATEYYWGGWYATSGWYDSTDSVAYPNWFTQYMDKRRDLYSLERSNYGNTRNENSFTGTSETARDQQYVQGTGVTWRTETWSVGPYEIAGWSPSTASGAYPQTFTQERWLRTENHSQERSNYNTTRNPAVSNSDSRETRSATYTGVVWNTEYWWGGWYDTSDWSPTTDTISYPNQFTQTRNTKNYYYRRQRSNYGVVANDNTWVSATNSTRSQTNTGTRRDWAWEYWWSAWSATSSWTPDPLSVNNGQTFTQTRTARRDQYGRERSNYSEIRNDNTFIYSETTTQSQSATGTATNSIAYTSFSAPGPVYPSGSFSAAATFNNNGTKSFGSNHYAAIRNASYTLQSSISASGVNIGASRSGTFTWQAPATPGSYTYYYCGLEDGLEWFNATTAFVLKVANPPTATITADSASLTMGQSTVVRASYAADTAAGDSLVQTAINMITPSVGETTVSGYGPGNLNYAFSPSAVGTYTFKNYLRTSIQSGWWSPSNVVITVSKGSTAVTISPAAQTITAGQSITFTASGAQTGYLWGGSAGASGSATTNTVTFASAGSFSVTVQDPGNSNWNPSATATATITVNAATTPATFAVTPTSFTYNGAAQGPTITPSPAAATYASTGTASATNAGSYTVTATANGSYTGNSGAVAWSIDKANQAAVSITSSSTSTFGSTYTATASGGNGTGAMVWALGTGSTAAGAAINSSSGVVSATGVGTVVFNAYRSGDGNYYQSATTGNFTLTVNPITTSFTVSPTSFSYNGAAQGPTITPSPAAATYSSSGSTSATLPGSYSLTATASGNYSGNSGAIAWSINKVAQTISFGSTTGKTYGDAPFDVYATASSGLPVTISVSSGPATISGTSITLTGAGTVVLSATQEGNTYYSAAPNVSQTFTVAQAAQTITLSPTSSTVLSTESVTFTVSGGVNAYSWGGSSGATGTGSTKTVSFPTAGTYTVTAQNSSSANYFASNVASATVTVNQAFTLSLSADPGGSVSGAGLFASGATASPTATANSGYVFAGWYGADSGSLSSTLSNPGSITMSAARNLTARFVDVSNIPTQSTIDFGAATIPTGTGKKNASRDSIMANVGNSPIELRAVQVVSGAADFSVSGTLGTIAGAANISNTVTFNPKGSALGSRTGRLVLITTDGLLPAIAYDLTGTASPGVLPPSISLSVTSLALIFPNDQIALNSRVDANQGNVAYYDWRVIKPSGVTAWSRFSGPLSSLVGSHGFTPTSTGVHTFEVMATHEDGPTSSASITFSVVQGLYTRTVSARNEPSTDLQLWFTPSATRTQSIEVWKSR